MARNYLMHFADNSHITFNLYDNPIVDAWIEVTSERIVLGHDKPIGQHGYWANYDDKIAPIQTIQNAISTLKGTVDLEFDSNNVTREKLNELHDRFHEFEEPLLKGEADYSPQVKQALHDLNECIHQLERTLEQTNNSKISYWVSQVDTDLDRRIKITEEWRKQYWNYTDTQKSCVLRLGYATIGKNAMHMVYDNNPELWPNSIRPQNNIHTETIVEYNPQPYKNSDSMNAGWRRDLEKFCTRNKIEMPTDAKHLHCVQPVIGELEQDLTQTQLAEKFRKIKFNRVEIV